MTEFMSGFHLIGGVTQLSIWGCLLVLAVFTQITIASVTIFLHRHQAHRALGLHPLISHFFRFWLWMTTGMVTREWVSIHRKHHARCETAEDPHSPQVLGIRKVLWQGAELYQAEAGKAETSERFGHGTPDDWLERHVYGRRSILGVSLLLVLDFILFGVIGISMWAVQMLWIPFWAAGVINGIGHWWGYRNYEPGDASRNIIPFGALVGGEELHNNHHAFPSSAKFSSRWWEFDLGWFYIRLLSILGLAHVKKLAPRPMILDCKEKVDMETVRAVIINRLHVMAQYAREVILPVLRQEAQRTDASWKRLLKQARGLLIRDASLIDECARGRLDRVLEQFSNLRTVYQYRQKLQAVWDRSATSHENLLNALQEWCSQAEATGIKALEEFSHRLRGYSLQAV